MGRVARYIATAPDGFSFHVINIYDWANSSHDRDAAALSSAVHRAILLDMAPCEGNAVHVDW